MRFDYFVEEVAVGCRDGFVQSAMDTLRRVVANAGRRFIGEPSYSERQSGPNIVRCVSVVAEDA